VTGADAARAGEPAGPRPRILLVDDDPTVARLVQHVLRLNGLDPATHVQTGREAIEAASAADIVLLDQQLPDLSGLEVLRAIQNRPDPPAVIVVTAHGSEALAAEALRSGADDYLAKDAAFRELLPQILERVRRVRALRRALAGAERDLLKAERRAAVGELVVTLHHEINNPLMAASAEIELLLAEAPDGRMREGLRAVKGALDRIGDIVRRIGALREASSTEYLPGVSMIDLDAGGVREVDRGTAVLYVPQEDVARASGLLLGSAGFRVVRCATPDDLAREAARDPAVVLAAGGPELIARLPAAPRRFTLIALAPGDPAPARAAGADHVITLPFDPGTLVQEVLGALRSRAVS